MREIKFRAWNDTCMLSWGWIRDMGMIGAVLLNVDGYYKVMQFTGLKEKNGKEIYEGDIVIIEDTYKEVILDDGSGPVEPANHLAPVIFNHASFGVDILESGDDFKKSFYDFTSVLDETGQDSFEVIGNIYENPELLKEK
jgi:uncharacterized phage protein (TIGR01671 family)